MNEKVKEILEWIYCIVIALVLALLFRYFIGTPTIVKQRSMYPTLKDGQRLILSRTFRITHNYPEVGDIITFEAPDKKISPWQADQSNPVAIYEEKNNNIFSKFKYYVLEIGKTSYIKRVIAKEGDHVKIDGGRVYVNNKELEEDYLADDVTTKSDVYNDFIVPEGYVFAMGDNRDYSDDCRVFGCIPLDKIEGKVLIRFWPISLFGKID